MRKLATSALALGLAFGTAAHAEGPNKLVTTLTAPEAQTQLMAMKDWHKLKPQLFRKQPYYLTGCDS